MPELLLQDREYSKHFREPHFLHRTVACERRERGPGTRRFAELTH
jgi:hypothetical protein